MNSGHQRPLDMEHIMKLWAENLTWAVISQRTGWSYQTIKKHIYRARKKKEADDSNRRGIDGVLPEEAVRTVPPPAA